MTTSAQRGHPWAGETVASFDREITEDTFAGSPSGPWLVVDAFGGQGSGPSAAELIAKELALAGEATERFAAAQARLTADISPNGCGGSAVRLTINGSVAELAWLGDCRAYLLRDNQATQLTRDHTIVQQWIDAGHITAADTAFISQYDNILVRALMGGVAYVPELVRVDLRPGDRILLISDGVWRALDVTATTIDLAGQPPESAVHQLVAAATNNRPHDDTTALLVAFTPT